MLRLLYVLLIGVLAVTVGADATEEARQKIASGMASGLQNNIELRRMLIGKHIDEAADFVAAAEQYRQIMRIQMESFGAGSSEVSAALKEGADFAEKHGLDKSLVTYIKDELR